MSFSPSPKASVCAALKPSRSREKGEARSLRDALGRELEEERERFEIQRRSCEVLARAGAELVERVGVADADELGREALEPGGRSPTGWIAIRWKSRVVLGCRCKPLDVELVVDVDVRREAGRARPRRSPRAPATARSAVLQEPAVGRGDDRALVADERLARVSAGSITRQQPTAPCGRSRRSRGCPPRAPG